MRTVIFVPGAGGSVLEFPNDPDDNDAVWPPSLFEFLTHYGRLPQLLDPTLEATEIIDTIPLNSLLSFPVYANLLRDLIGMQDDGYINYVPFPFDFRKCVSDSAAALAAKIEECWDDGGGPIALVCHSTGNQVGRAVLENPQYQTQPWFGGIDLYIGMCGPHYGVPGVLEYGLGLDDWLSISAADMRTFSRDERYPGMYQLFPYQGRPVLMDAHTGAQNIYNPAVAAEFTLDWNNLGAATGLQTRLDDFSNKPGGVRYVIIAGNGQSTDEVILYDGTTYDGVATDDSGDGTVPLWSAAPGQFSPLVVPGDHFSVLSSPAVRACLWNLLAGAPAPSYLIAGLGAEGAAISLNRQIYAPGEAISMLVIPDQPTTKIAGTLEIEKAAPDARAFKRLSSQPFAYRGPPIRSIRAELTAPADPGLYRVTLRGKTHSTAPQTTAIFAVSADRRRR